MSALTASLSIILAMIAYSMLNIGLALEKKGASEIPKIENQTFFQNLSNFLRNKFWLIGFILTNIQWLFFLGALEFGSLSLVTPIMGFGLVALTIFSYFYLKEPISLLEIIGIIFVIIGVVVLGITNPAEEITYTIEETNTRLVSINSIIFFAILIVLAIIAVLFSVINKFSFADIAFGLSGGIASGIGVIFSKAFMSGLDLSNFGTSFLEAINRWEWWLFLFLLIFFNIISVVLPQVGFQKGKAIIVTPIFSIIALLVPAIGGIVIFSEWNNLQLVKLILKSISLFIITIGVGILTISSISEKEEKKEKSDDGMSQSL